MIVCPKLNWSVVLAYKLICIPFNALEALRVISERRKHHKHVRACITKETNRIIDSMR